MNRSFSKDGIFCPLTRFRWLPLSSKFRWRKWVSPQKVNINGDLLESEKENVSTQGSSQCEHLAHSRLSEARHTVVEAVQWTPHTTALCWMAGPLTRPVHDVTVFQHLNAWAVGSWVEGARPNIYTPYFLYIILSYKSKGKIMNLKGT